MSHSQFKFKSSGFRHDDRRFHKERTVVKPIGIKTPLEVGDDIFKMHTNPLKQVSDNLRNLIMTNQGERLCRYKFGVNLRSILFEYSNFKQYEQSVGQAISSAVSQYMPMVSLNDIDVQIVDDEEKNSVNRYGLTKVRIRVSFSVPKLRSNTMSIDIDLYVGG